MTTMQKALQDCVTALEEACGNRCNAEYNPCYAREAITQAEQVLANSAIDQMIVITQELGLYPAPEATKTAAVMQNGSIASNVYEAFEAGLKFGMANERKECAKLCDEKAGTSEYDASTCSYLAKDISARG